MNDQFRQIHIFNLQINNFPVLSQLLKQHHHIWTRSLYIIFLTLHPQRRKIQVMYD